MPPTLLAADAVIPYLVGRGVLLPGGTGATAVELSGGVSNAAFLIETPARRLVLKQALPLLRVARRWEAPVDRILTEARALRFAAALEPAAVPTVIDTDPTAYTLTMTAAPASWQPWKSELMAGRVDPAVAIRLGTVLGRLHRAAAEQAWLEQTAAFEALRVAPYHRAVIEWAAGAGRPEIAAGVQQVVDRMAGRRLCFVHGDYSPKNVLVGVDGVWVIDFEVAHRGDPAFDVAFCLSHLVLKSIHLPASTTALRQAAEAFVAAYAEAGRAEATDESLSPQLAALLLARVVGKSPVEYLRPPEQRRVLAVGAAALDHPPADLAGWWRLIDDTEAASDE